MAKEKKIPMRKCIGCGLMQPKKELLRIVRTPEEEILLDATGRKNGRGAYLCKDSSCLETAFKRGGLERAFGMKVSDEIKTSLRKELEELEQT